MVRDLELPFTYHTRMSRCQLKFLLYLLTKQDGDIKPKWWPDNIPYNMPISNLSLISKESLIDLFKSYYKYKGDSKWLRAILSFTINLENLTNETDFTSINTSGKITHKGVEFDFIPPRESISPNGKMHLVTPNIIYKKTSILNISPAVVEHFKSNKLEKNKNSGIKVDTMDLTDVETKEADVKLCIKESHIKQLMPVASVQLYDVVRYNTMHSKEDFMLKLNLMKTDVLSKLNLLKFRKRLRNTSRDSVKSASEFEKDLIKFKSKPNKDVLKEQSKQKENNKKTQIKKIEKDKTESSTINIEYMDVDNESLPLSKIVADDMNKENENIENSPKESQTTAVNPISPTKTSLPFQQKANKIVENSECAVIDLTLEDSPTKVKNERNNLFQFLNMSPIISPKVEKKIKLSSPKKLKRLKRLSMPLVSQKNIKSYFNPIPLKITPEFIAKKLEELKRNCRPCFVKLDLVKDLKPIRSFTEDSTDEIKTEIINTLPLQIVTEKVMEDNVKASSFIDLTSDDGIIESSVIEYECKETTSPKEEKNKKETDLKLNKVESTNGQNQEPKNELNKNKAKKKKVIIKVKWPSKRITL